MNKITDFQVLEENITESGHLDIVAEATIETHFGKQRVVGRYQSRQPIPTSSSNRDTFIVGNFRLRDRYAYISNIPIFADPTRDQISIPSPHVEDSQQQFRAIRIGLQTDIMARIAAAFPSIDPNEMEVGDEFEATLRPISFGQSTDHCKLTVIEDSVLIGKVEDDLFHVVVDPSGRWQVMTSIGVNGVIENGEIVNVKTTSFSNDVAIRVGKDIYRALEDKLSLSALREFYKDDNFVEVAKQQEEIRLEASKVFAG